MTTFHDSNQWALILGASSGMGLATARKMAKAGLNLVLLHRDRRGQLDEIHQHFDDLSREGVEVKHFNIDALSEEKRKELISEWKTSLPHHSIKLLLHSVSKGNLKLMTQPEDRQGGDKTTDINQKLISVQELYDDIQYPQVNLNETDFSLTAQAMATSMLSWTQDLFDAGLFAEKARVIGLTSEGDIRVWKGYGAVAAAKATLEAISKYMAVEFASKGLTTNLIQAGITSTPSLNMIPGSDLMQQSAILRNPMNRLTQPEDVANVVYLLIQEEANWINGARIVVDGGEHLV